MDRDFSGQIIKNKKGLWHWAGLFEEWRLLNEKICRLNPQDAPYWYNEMANVSVLAGAAWRAGWAAMSEISTQKTIAEQSHWGRADLFIQNDFKHEYIEAKYSGANASSSDKVIATIDRTLSWAISDAESTAGVDNDAVGVTFVAPYWSAKQMEIRHRNEEYDFDQEIEALIDIVSANSLHAFAWSFPSASRHLPDGENNIWPGVFLVVKNIHIK